MKNKLIVICLIFFMLISISAVSAENNNTDIISIENNDDNAISINNLNDNDILSTDDGSFAALNKTVNGDSSTSITLDHDYSYSSTDTIKEGIVINKDNLTIDGKGHTIDAKGQSRIFYVNSTTVYLKNIKFVNGNAEFANSPSGGAIYGDGDNFRIINCTFISNKATNWGGAIHSYPSSLAVILNSTFVDNSAKYGGAVSVIYGYRQYIINSTFESNRATFDGGAIAIYGKQAYTDRPYEDKLTIDGSVFIGNNATDGDAISNIHSASVDIMNSILLGNVENLIYNDVYFVNANNNWFGNTYDNRSVRPNIPESIEMKNWLYLDLVPDLATSSVTVSINNLYDCDTGKTSTYVTSKLPSIAVNVNADNSIIDIEKVVLGHSGSAGFDFVFLNDTIFTANYQASTISKKVNGGSFTDLQRLINAAQDGDVITLEKDYVYIKGSDIMTQGIQISKKHNLVIDGNGHSVNAEGNTRVFITDKESDNIVFKNLIIANGYLYSSDSGSGLYLSSDNSQIINCTFISNVADALTGGAAVYVHASHISIDDCRFINNTHVYSTAGALYLMGEDLTVSNTLFENNSAVGYAGAVLSYDECDIINCTFKNNSAQFAGAIFNYGQINIRDSRFIANRAVKGDGSDIRYGSGGAVYAVNATITNCVFTYNEATLGAAIAIASNDTVVDKCIFINNTKSYNGVVYSLADGGKVSNSIFLNNDVTGYVISCLYGGLISDYNWFGNTWKNYGRNWDVSNLAVISNWLFLNATEFTFDDQGDFNLKFTFLEYDSATEKIIQYDDNDLPEIDLYLSSQNLTLNKNVVKIGQTIRGHATSYKGALYGECENVKYELLFKHLIKSQFEVNSTINVFVDNSKYVDFNLIPFESDYLLFLESNKRLTITSNDTSIAKIVSKASGLYVTGVKPGIALLTLKFNGINVIGEDKYTPSEATILVNVTRVPTHIEFIYDVMDMGISENGYIYAMAADYKNNSFSGSSLNYVNNNESVINLAGNSFRTLSEGLANVTVSFAGNNKYEPCSLDVTFKVAKRHVTIEIDRDELELFVGQYYLLGPYVREITGACLNCSSNDTSVATIDDKGVVTAIGKGIANLTIRYDGNNRFSPSEVYVIVTVIDFETYIDVESEKELNITDWHQVYPVIKNAKGEEISVPVNTKVYSSNDTSVVTVDESGFINATGEGIANVTVSFNGYREYQPSSASMIVKVTIPRNDIVAESEVDLHVGETHKINATLEHEPFGFKLSDFNYEVNDTNVVRITTTGYLTGISEGTAKITIKYDSIKYVPSNATVIVKVVKGTTKITSTDSISLHVDEKEKINANLTSLWENKNITGLKYETGDNKVAKVDRYGLVTAVGVGQTNITVKYDGSNKYYGDSTKVLVTVDYVPTTINVGKTFSLIIDENETLEASLEPSKAGSLNYTSGDENVVTVDENGFVTAVGAGQTEITVSFAGNEKYAPASEKVLVTIFTSNIPTSIDVNDTFELYVNDTVNINAVINPSNAGNLTYESSNPSIVSVDSNGLITGVDIGETDIIVKFKDENGRFLESNATVHVKVSAIPTTITADGPMTINLTENSTIRYEFSHPEAGDVEFIIENSSILTIENGVAIANKIGKTNVTIKFNGNKKYFASNATILVNVVDVETSIEADDINVNLTESASIGAILTPDVGKLTYTSTNSSIVTVDENGVVTGVKVGEADVIVKFEATGKYRQSTKTVHVVVIDVETLINASDIIVNVTESASIGAVLTPEEAGKLTYTSTNSSIVTVDGKGVVIGLNVGETDILISFEATGKYRQANKTIKVKVVDVETSIEASDVIVNVTESASIGAVLTPSKAGKLTYTSNDSSIVTVDDNGIINAIGVGEADIFINFEVNGKYRQSNKTIHVKVTTVPTEIKVNDTISLLVDESANIVASLSPISGKLSYSSNDSSIASVDNNGKVTANGQGIAVITVSYIGEGKYLPSQSNVTVKVSRIPTELSIGEVNLEIGDAKILNPTLTPRVYNPKFTYASNDTDVVEIDEKGFIYAVSSGTALVTISYSGNEKYLASNTTFTLSIGARVTSIDVEKDIEIGFGESRDLGACVVTRFYQTTLPMTYESSDPSIVSVDKNGRITAHKIGTATIDIKFAGEQSFAPSNATVNVTVTTKTTEMQVDKDSISIYVDDQANIEATLIGGPQNSKLTYQSSNIAVASVDSTGKIRANGEGSALITVSYAGDNEYHSSSAAVNVTVSKIPTKIVSENKFEMKVFETIALNAVLTPQNGILSYSSGDNEMATVDSTGRLTAKSTGNVVVTIKFAGDRKYLPSQKQVIVSISKVPTSINLTDITLYSGETLKLENVLNPSDAPVRYLTFDSGDLEVFDVTTKGLITTFQEGTADLFVTFKGNDAYMPSNATVLVNVIKKTLTADECSFNVEVSDDAGEAKFTVNVPKDASGNFMVIVDGEIYGDEDNIVDGVGIVNVDELAPGDHKVTMRYTGDEKYFSVSNQTTIHIYRIRIDKNKDISVVYTDNAIYKVHLTRDTQAMEGKTVTFKINGKTYYAKTDMLGYASVKLPKLAIKTYTITASYKGIRVTNKVTSMHIVVAKNLKAKKTKALKIKVTLNKVNSKILAKKKVTLKFNGKKYTAKTNKKGAVTFTIAKSVLANLKVGKSYTYKVTYSKDTVSKKIKIVK